MEVEMSKHTTEIKSGDNDAFASFLAIKSSGGPGKNKIAAVAITLLAIITIGGAAYKIWGDAEGKTKTLAGAGSNRAVLTVELTPVKRSGFERKLLVSGTVSAWDP